MPLRKPDPEEINSLPIPARTIPPEAYEYEAPLNPEAIKLIQERADKTLLKEEWVVIDGVNKR
jgi:hypothetical protein